MARADGVQGNIPERSKEEHVNSKTGKKEVRYEGDTDWAVE